MHCGAYPLPRTHMDHASWADILHNLRKGASLKSGRGASDNNLTNTSIIILTETVIYNWKTMNYILAETVIYNWKTMNYAQRAESD